MSIHTSFFSTHKQCIPALCTTTLQCFPLKPYTLAGFEPGSSVPEAETMSIAPRPQGIHMFKLLHLY
jgi:hypothetical protein